MSRARPIVAGSTYILTRRCFEQRFQLVPSPAVNGLIAYVLAYAAEKYGVLLHACCVMSNHIHLVVTDPQATLPAFCQEVFSLVARAMNRKLDRRESFWAPGSYSAVRLMTPGAVTEKIAYTLTNPVAAGLVRRGKEWPGLWTAPDWIGGEGTDVARPEEFFDDEGPMPATARLRLHLPAGFESFEAFHAQLGEELRRHEDEAASRLEEEGRTFVGAARAVAPLPASWKPSPGRLWKLKPRIATRDRRVRILALAQLRDFLIAYREALAKWRRGMRDAVFPHGTYLMRVQHFAQCAASP